MKYEKTEKGYVISLDNKEKAQDVLRAIAMASFELARPVGMGFFQFNEGTAMTQEEADAFITIPPQYGDTVLGMDYVQGRQCKTYVSQDGENFVLNAYSFERDRGEATFMLDRAKEILNGKEKQSKTDSSTIDSFRGKSLDLRMAEYGFKRNNGETDWDFRKRVFPDFFQIDPARAVEFLYAKATPEWDDMDQMLFLTIASAGSDRQRLIKFAKAFHVDPSTRGGMN